MPLFTPNMIRQTAHKVIRFTREPFVHFLFLGSLMFAVNAFWGEEQGGINRDITVSASDITRLEALWQSQYNRPPSATERDAIVESHIREEVLFREARALRLGDDDLIVRRRLVQKFLFLSEDLMAVETPSDPVLDVYYSKHQDRYRIASKTTFSHVFFSNEGRNEGSSKMPLKGAKQSAVDVIEALQINDEDWRGLGDPFILQREYTGLEADKIARLFGGQFATMLNGLAEDGWHGPVQSAYGWHAVKVHARSISALPALSDVREAVIRDYKLDQKQTASQAFYRSVLERYSVSVEADSDRLIKAMVSSS